MFITIQFPFVDARWFLPIPPEFVPDRENAPPSPDEKNYCSIIEKNRFIRHFGAFKPRGFIPNGNNSPSKKKHKRPAKHFNNEDQWAATKGLWMDEYIFSSIRSGLHYHKLEKHNILKGELHNPRSKMRALRIFPFSFNHALWTPCIRIEIGILYDTKKPLTRDDLVKTINEFLELPITVKEKRTAIERIINKRKPERKSVHSTLAGRRDALRRLIVSGTTSQTSLRTREDLVISGTPLITIHHYPDEAEHIHDNATSISRSTAKGEKISYQRSGETAIDAWIFELPKRNTNKSKSSRRIEIVRNNTIAIMRYWSEWQGLTEIIDKTLSEPGIFDEENNNLLQRYINDSTKFLFSEKWHGASISEIRNMISAYREAYADDIDATKQKLKGLRAQIARKASRIHPTKDLVFVGYSHKDSAHLNSIRKIIESSPRLPRERYFDDTTIGEGQEWNIEIKRAIDDASLAILLLSESFNNSEYIQTKELPYLMKRFNNGALDIIPVLVDGTPADYSPLDKLQFANAAQPLSTITPDEITHIANRILKRITIHPSHSLEHHCICD